MAYATIRVSSLLALGLLFLCCICEAKHKVRCSNYNEAVKPTSMKPSEDGVKGRYTVEWCTNITKSVGVWSLHVLYNNRNHRICSQRDTHSLLDENLDITDVNCSSVCISTDLDVIFSGCYTLQNSLPLQGSLRKISTHNISNVYTFDTFARPPITGKEVNHGDYISATFFLGNIPATKYDIQLCNVTEPTCNEDTCCSDVTGVCGAATVTELRCRLPALAPGGYELRLTHRAPWAVNQLLRDRRSKVLKFNVTAETEATGPGAGSAWRRSALVGLGAALGALGVGAALLLAWSRLAPRAHLRKRVLADWLGREENKQAAEESGAGGPILLLYAREGPALDPCIEALTRLLETVAPGQVFDLYSPVTTALAAGCADAWLRAAAQRPGARLILLQTPALQALHAPADNHSTQPLLGGRSIYRTPLAGDRLLPLALRLAQQDPHPSYHKYYLATIEGLETEALPYTVPFRRFVLPTHALALLQQLQPPAVTAPAAVAATRRQLADELALATRDFVDHARANPHYLMDELIII